MIDALELAKLKRACRLQRKTELDQRAPKQLNKNNNFTSQHTKGQQQLWHTRKEQDKPAADGIRLCLLRRDDEFGPEINTTSKEKMTNGQVKKRRAQTPRLETQSTIRHKNTHTQRLVDARDEPVEKVTVERLGQCITRVQLHTEQNERRKRKRIVQRMTATTIEIQRKNSKTHDSQADYGARSQLLTVAGTVSGMVDFSPRTVTELTQHSNNVNEKRARAEIGVTGSRAR